MTLGRRMQTEGIGRSLRRDGTAGEGMDYENFPHAAVSRRVA